MIIDNIIEFFYDEDGSIVALNGELNSKGIPYLSEKTTIGSLISQGKNILIYESFYGIFPNRTISNELLNTRTILKNH